MTRGLRRNQEAGDLHFITMSCHQRQPYLGSAQARNVFLDSLERMRRRYVFTVTGYVVMPEHVHLLLSEPPGALLATALQALKISVTRFLPQRPFWTRRYYDLNVFSPEKRVEKLRYIHRNPVKRGLCQEPEHWEWSSFCDYWNGRSGLVEVECPATERRRAITP